jgi:hypothetical protein
MNASTTDDLYNSLTILKPSQRVEYLQLNGYNNIDEILRKYSEYKNNIRAGAIKERKTSTKTKPNKIINDAVDFINTIRDNNAHASNSVIIPFKTDDDPPPSFDFKVWGNNEIIPATLPLPNKSDYALKSSIVYNDTDEGGTEDEADKLSVILNIDDEGDKYYKKTTEDSEAYEYLINLKGDCYNIFINSYVVIEIDKTTKTIKIIDDIEGRNKEILNINI